jgi:hypothetical protein
MRSDLPDAQFFIISALIVLAVIWIVVAFARECYCDTCPNGFAIWMRGEKQLCRECKKIHDRNAHRFHYRRPLWRRLLGRAR